MIFLADADWHDQVDRHLEERLSLGGVDDNRAPRPRPSPRLFMAQHLPCQLQVG